MINDPMKLPKIGDRLMRIMTTYREGTTKPTPKPCVVIYVNKPHFYYTIRFIETGIKESYKVPDVDEIAAFKADYTRFFGTKPKGVYVYESGALYPSIKACAEAIGVAPCSISKHIHGQANHVKGYHIFML